MNENRIKGNDLLSRRLSPNSYLLYLDGLRAVAIVGVLLFHHDNTWLSGGFLGVDIFFVISGFIITKLLYEEWNKTGDINFKRFWFRRLRRLTPVAFIMMIITLIFVLTLFPDEVTQISEDLPYSITFTNNWNYIINERSYFELIGRPRLFEHLWSLGVEFQFYLIWFFACFWLFRLPRWAVCSIVIYMILYSTFVMAFLYNPKEDPSRVYFGTDTRSSALFMGALVGLMIHEFELQFTKMKYQLISSIGMLSMVGLVLFFVYAKPTNTYLFTGGFLGVSLLTSIVIVSCYIISKQNYFSIVSIVLSTKIFRIIGVRAYGIYLWHWVVFGLTQPFVDVPMEGLNLFLFRIALTVFLSEMTYQFIESPIRRGFIERAINSVKSSTGHEKRKLITLWAFVGCVSLAGCSSLIVVTKSKLIEVVQQPSENEDTLVKTENVTFEEKEIQDEHIEQPTIDNVMLDDSQKSQDAIVKASNNLSNPIIQPHLKLDRAKNGKGYVNRVRTIDDAGEKTPIFLLGDSVMIGATPELLARIPHISIDSQVGRQLNKGIEIIADRKNKGLLSDTVIIHLGNNSPIISSQMEELINLLKDTKRIIFINLKLPRNYESANNRLFNDSASKNPKITIIDWRSNSMNAKNVFAKDGIHLTNKGAKLYATLVMDTILKEDGKL